MVQGLRRWRLGKIDEDGLLREMLPWLAANQEKTGSKMINVPAWLLAWLLAVVVDSLGKVGSMAFISQALNDGDLERADQLVREHCLNGRGNHL